MPSEAPRREMICLDNAFAGPRIGLALGGGAFRGMAHVGVLQVLRENSIEISCVAGTSIGAFVGAVFCAGGDLRMLEKLSYTLDDRSLWDIVVPRQGLIRGRRVQELAMTLTHDASFEDIDIPFAAVACDVSNGEQVLIRSGKLHEAVRASVSIPGVFEPCIREGRMLVDGALVNRLPADVVSDMGADVVIAVDVAFSGQQAPVSGAAQILMRAFDIAQWETLRARRTAASILLSPACALLDSITLADAEKAVAAGRRCAEAALPALRRLIEKLPKKKLRKKPPVQVDGETVIYNKKTRESGPNAN